MFKDILAGDSRLSVVWLAGPHVFVGQNSYATELRWSNTLSTNKWKTSCINRLTQLIYDNTVGLDREIRDTVDSNIRTYSTQH